MGDGQVVSTASIDDIVATLRAGAAAVGAGGSQATAAAAAGQATDRKALKQHVVDSATRVHLKATSVGMLWGDTKRRPTKDEGSGLLAEYEQSVLHFCALCHGAAESGGATLREAMQASVSKVVETSCALLVALGDNKKQAAVTSLTGIVWEACEAAKKMPLDDRTAIGRRMTLVASSLKDAEREAKEILQEPSTAERDDDGIDGEVFSNDDDLDYEADELSPEERAVAGAGLALVQAILLALKMLIKGILTQDFPSEASSVASIEAALRSIIATGRSTEDVVAGLYGPQDPPDIGESLKRVKRNWEAVVEELRGFGAYRTILADGGTAVNEKLSQLQASLVEP